MKKMVAEACRTLVQSRHSSPPSWPEGTIPPADAAGAWIQEDERGARREPPAVRRETSSTPKTEEGAGASALVLKMEPKSGGQRGQRNGEDSLASGQTGGNNPGVVPMVGPGPGLFIRMTRGSPILGSGR